MVKSGGSIHSFLFYRPTNSCVGLTKKDCDAGHAKPLQAIFLTQSSNIPTILNTPSLRNTNEAADRLISVTFRRCKIYESQTYANTIQLLSPIALLLLFLEEISNFRDVYQFEAECLHTNRSA